MNTRVYQGTFCILLTFFAAIAWADHTPVDDPDFPIIEVPSLLEATPPDQKTYLGNRQKSKINFRNIQEIVGGLLWNGEDELAENIYDNLSNFSISEKIVNKDLFGDDGSLRVDWEGNMRRWVYLDGPMSALSDKPYKYYELNTLLTRLRVGVGYGLDSLPSNFGVNVFTGVGVAFHYAKQTELYKLRELRIIEEDDENGDDLAAKNLSLFLGGNGERRDISAESKKALAKSHKSLTNNLGQIISFFEDGIEKISEKFVDDDRGKAIMSNVFDPLRMPSKLIRLDNKIIPIDDKKIKKLKKNEMVFFTTYFDLGVGIGAKNGITRASINKPVRLAYHAAVKKMSKSSARMKVQWILNNDLEIPRIETRLKKSFGFIRVSYDLFRYVHKHGNQTIIEYIYQYDLNRRDGKKAFNAMLRMDPVPSIEAVLNKSGGVFSVIGRRDVKNKTRSQDFLIQFPELAEYRVTSSKGVKTTSVYDADQSTLLSRTLDGHVELSRKFRYNLIKWKEDEERSVQALVSTDLNEDNQVRNRLGNWEFAEAQKEPAISNAKVNLSYFWSDKETSPREYEDMVSFLKHLFAEVPEVANNRQFKDFTDRDIVDGSTQNFAVKFSFSQSALGDILNKDSEDLWRAFGEEIFGDNRWNSEKARREYRESLNEEEGFNPVCTGSGLIYSLYQFRACEDFYVKTWNMARGYSKIQKARSVTKMTDRFNKLAVLMGENPGLAFVMLKMSDDLNGVNYDVLLNGEGLGKEVLLSNREGEILWDNHYGPVLPNVGQIRDTIKTVRRAEVFVRKDNKKVVLALETSRLMSPEDTLYFELYKFLPIYKDKFRARYKVSGALNPIELAVPARAEPEDMTVSRYRYEFALPDGFLNQFKKDGKYDKNKYEFQFVFVKPDLSQSLSEVGEVLFKPHNAGL